MKKIAVFDIDGTLFRWQLFHELVFELININAIDKLTGQSLEEKFISWRALKASWRDYEDQVVDVLMKKIVDISPAVIDLAAQNVIDRSGHKVYGYTSSLIKKLTTEGYFLVAITGSPQQIAEPFANLHGFNECLGVVWKKNPKTGLFTNEYERSVIGNKDKILDEYMDTNGFKLKDSVGVGDTLSDYNLLKKVENPIAFNPDAELLERAKNYKWNIVVERKNIAYKLKNNGSELIVVEIISF